MTLGIVTVDIITRGLMTLSNDDSGGKYGKCRQACLFPGLNTLGLKVRGLG